MRRTTRPRSVRLLAAGLIFAAPFTFSACDALAEKALEESLEKAVESDGECKNAEIDLDQEQVGAELGCDGDTIAVGGNVDLPADFPKKDVPLVKGTLVTATSGHEGAGSQGAGWYLIIAAEGPADEVAAEARRLLEDAGFSEDADLTGTGGDGLGILAGYTKPGYAVSVIVAEDASSGTSSVQYTVAVE